MGTASSPLPLACAVKPLSDVNLLLLLPVPLKVQSYGGVRSFQNFGHRFEGMEPENIKYLFSFETLSKEHAAVRPCRRDLMELLVSRQLAEYL